VVLLLLLLCRQLISGDNKGYASYLTEKHMNNGTLPGKGPFVAAFASTNLGDVSPNTAGPTCIDTGRWYCARTILLFCFSSFKVTGVIFQSNKRFVCDNVAMIHRSAL
jgi:hypothetical protein